MNNNLIINKTNSAMGVKPLFEKFHYLKSISKGCPDVYELINAETGEILGACQIGIPASRHYDMRRYKEIRRFVLVPGAPKNLASWFLSRCLKDIKSKYRNIESVIAFSDPAQGHEGTIYKASNFLFTGQGKPGQIVKVGRKKLHARTVFNKCKGGQVRRKALVSAIQAVGYKWVKTPGKYRFEYVF